MIISLDIKILTAQITTAASSCESTLVQALANLMTTSLQQPYQAGPSTVVWRHDLPAGETPFD